MAAGVEQAENGRGRGLSVFPSEWGVPAGRQFSPERARWVAARVREHRALNTQRQRAREMSSRGDGGQRARRRALLMRRRYAPTETTP